MAFPQIAKDNLAAALSLANIFTDPQGNYLPLNIQLKALSDIRGLLNWQLLNRHAKPISGGCPVKKILISYINLESSVDLFMRYINIPECPLQANLAYIDDKLQKLIYNNFKEKVLRRSLSRPGQPLSSSVELAIRQLIIEKVLGYSKREPWQDKEEWKIFVAEIDVGIARLSEIYEKILQDFYAQFDDFRQGQLLFLKNYFKCCFFLAQLEQWLNQGPSLRLASALADSEIDNFCQQLLRLEQSYLEFDLSNLNRQLLAMQQKKLNQDQQKTLVRALIQLKPKYDAYRPGQDRLSPEEQLQEFSKCWPKPQFKLLKTLSRQKRPKIEIAGKASQAKRQEQAEDKPLHQNNLNHR